MKPVSLHPKQAFALLRLLDSYTTVVVYGGAGGGGKSWLGCTWLLQMVLSYPHTKWFISRLHMTQIKKSTLATFYKVCRYYGVSKKLFHFNGETNIITCLPTGAAIELVSFAYQPSSPDFDQYGSTEYTGGWLEEGQESSREAYSALRSRCGRAENERYGIAKKILITCNPKKNWLYADFYQLWVKGELPYDTVFIQAFCKDNPDLPKSYVDDLERLPDQKMRDRILHGKWEYADDPEQVITYDLLLQCVGLPVRSGTNTMGVDVAKDGENADYTVIQVVKGNRIDRPIIISGRDYIGPTEKWEEYCADAVIRAANANNVKAIDIRVDTTGLGAGVWSVLRSKGWTTTKFVAGDSPFVRPGVAYRFKNIRTQATWELREGMKAKKYSIAEDYDSLLFDDLCGYHYFTNDNMIVLEDKSRTRKRIGRSPDRGDALVMATYEPKPVSTSSAQSVRIERPKSSL